MRGLVLSSLLALSACAVTPPPSQTQAPLPATFVEQAAADLVGQLIGIVPSSTTHIFVQSTDALSQPVATAAADALRDLGFALVTHKDAATAATPSVRVSASPLTRDELLLHVVVDDRTVSRVYTVAADGWSASPVTLGASR